MKFYFLLSAAVVFAFSSCNNAPGGKVSLGSSIDSVSYAVGVSQAESFLKNLEQPLPTGENINKEIFINAFNAAFSGKALQISKDSTESILKSFTEKIRASQMAKMEAEQKVVGEAAAKEGKVFLDSIAKVAGVQSTKSGLYYKVVKKGTGAKPTATDKVKVDYEGKLVNGTVFDSSIKRGKPAEFDVAHLIPGFTEALEMMPVGSKWTLYIPSNLAYGEHGTQGIAPNSTLIFDVTLISIEPQAKK